jgi:LmbE family N-acetylglucosaminyl deacetylase
MPAGEAKRLLLAMAHPDDESFGMAGTIARYVGEGVEVHLICATNGDVGTADPEHMQSYESMAQLRLAELTCAAAELGIARVFTFGYRDSGMTGSPDNDHPASLHRADPDNVARRIAGVIREVRPQVVVTFDPFGGYGHPDHIKMHDATRLAFEAAGDPLSYPEQAAAGLEPYRPQKLYYRTRGRGFWKVMVNVLPLFGVDPERMGRNHDINVREIVEHTYPIHARIATRRVSEQAERARLCHASQLGGFATPGLLQRLQRVFVDPHVDTYMRAYPPVNGRQRLERDLFEGLNP